MKAQQHKKLLAAIVAEMDRTYERAKGLPKQGAPYAFLCGRYTVYGQIAHSKVYSRYYQELADLCAERIGFYARYTPKPQSWHRAWVFQQPWILAVEARGHVQACHEVLALLKEYVGVVPRSKWEAA